MGDQTPLDVGSPAAVEAVIGTPEQVNEHHASRFRRAGNKYLRQCDTVGYMPQGHGPFAVFNRTANPIVRAVLSSPLHPLLSRGLALITVTGLRTGRRYTFPVGYRRAGDRVLVRVGAPARKRWWRNLRDGDRVEMLIRGQRYDGYARALGDEHAGVTVEVDLNSDAGNSPRQREED